MAKKMFLMCLILGIVCEAGGVRGFAGEKETPPAEAALKEIIITTIKDLVPGTLTISPNGKSYAYIARRAGKFVVVKDEKEFGPYNYINKDLVFSPNSFKLAYVVSDDCNKLKIVIDGVVLYKGIREVKNLAFDVNSTRIIDNSNIKPIISPSGKYLAGVFDTLYFVSHSPNITTEYTGKIVACNGVSGTCYEEISDITFSPNSSRVAYFAKWGGWFVVVRNTADKSKSKRKGLQRAVNRADREGKGYGALRNFAFAPNSRKYAYIAIKGKKEFIVQNSSKHPGYTRITVGPVFSPDSKKMAYCAWRNNKCVLIINRNEVLVCEKILDIVFAKETYAYISKEEFKPRVIVGEKKHKQYDDIKALTTDPLGNVTYQAKSNGKWHLVVDGKEGPAADDIQQVTHSLDKKHTAYFAKIGMYWAIVLNNKIYGKFSEIPEGSRIRFNDGELNTIVRRDNKLVFFKISTKK